MTLQVHDELVFDALITEVDNLKPVIEHEMEAAIPGLSVPNVVENGNWKHWLDAHWRFNHYGVYQSKLIKNSCNYL